MSSRRYSNGMNQIVTTGIVLSRTNYGEADRILTLITPDHGKLRLMAKGVRKVKSKLAGGIELFSVSNITCIQGRGDIGTLVSTRLLKHYGEIVTNIDRVQLGYDLLKLLNKITEDNSEAAYFELLVQTFQALDEPAIGEELIRTWFAAQLLRLGGHTPNLRTDAAGKPLSPGATYDFDYSAIAFMPYPSGSCTPDHSKYLRLIFSGNQPHVLRQVEGYQALLPGCTMIIQTMLNTFVRI